ncbi:MAG: nucleotidyl transferase AbiEii/AbiGii toxin family protein [Acidobacteria bacterium]|nr:nucleotidyl transferase AbiEii/AbiGii toxin family protein [Acidobacteriota bacterium]
MELDDVLAVIRAFNEHGVKYVLIGGVAVNLHGLVRGTEDVDFLVDPDAGNFSRIRRALKSLFQDSSIDEITAEDAGRYAVIRYGPPEGRYYIDLLTRIGEAFRYGEIKSETVNVNGIPVCVATPRALYRMKRNTLRGKDRDDALALRIRFGFAEEDVD